MKELGGLTAFVTGAGSGIGRGIALALAAERMQVAVADTDAAGAERGASERARVKAVEGDPGGVSREALGAGGAAQRGFRRCAPAGGDGEGEKDLRSPETHGSVRGKSIRSIWNDLWLHGGGQRPPRSTRLALKPRRDRPMRSSRPTAQQGRSKWGATHE